MSDRTYTMDDSGKKRRVRSICRFDGCGRYVVGQGWCGKHYQQFRDLSGQPPCAVDECQAPATVKGWCKNHYYQLRDQALHPCNAEGCTERRKSHGWCQNHAREYSSRRRVCPECGTEFAGHERRKYCSRSCKVEATTGPVRLAVEAGDGAGVITAARDCSAITAEGCWIWKFGRNPAGYAVIGRGGSGGVVHRHIMAATLGRRLRGRTEVVHHKCAHRACVNPEHLQTTTQRENMAEMFKRQHYEARIAELEAQLAATLRG